MSGSARYSRGHSHSTDGKGRRYCRVCNRERRRNSMILPASIPRERLVPLIERRWTRHDRTLRELAERTGISIRAIEDLMRGDRARWTFNNADKLVAALDVRLWFVPPPEGLGDLYGGVDVADLGTYDRTNGNAPAAHERSGARHQEVSPDAHRR